MNGDYCTLLGTSSPCTLTPSLISSTQSSYLPPSPHIFHPVLIIHVLLVQTGLQLGHNVGVHTHTHQSRPATLKVEPVCVRTLTCAVLGGGIPILFKPAFPVAGWAAGWAAVLLPAFFFFLLAVPPCPFVPLPLCFFSLSCCSCVR